MVENQNSFDQDNVGRIDHNELILHSEKIALIINASKIDWFVLFFLMSNCWALVFS